MKQKLLKKLDQARLTKVIDFYDMNKAEKAIMKKEEWSPAIAELCTEFNITYFDIKELVPVYIKEVGKHPNFKEDAFYTMIGIEMIFRNIRKFKSDKSYTDHTLSLISQSPLFRVHSFHCTTRRKILNDKTNLYPIVKSQVIYQYTNRKAIQKYESQINNLKLLIELKYQPQLLLLQEQKRELKLKLKSGEIDNKAYQKLYTPIRKNRDKVQFYIWDICYRFKGRYFSCGRLKEIYR